jgi:predicted nucleotidyltransferase
MSAPEEVLSDLRAAARDALGDRLAGLYAHGSLVEGDFAPERSDLDVLAVLTVEPDDVLAAVLAELHNNLDRRHPRWAGRIEVEYVPLAAIGGGAGHLMARTSPGEPLHLMPVTSHRAVTWSSVRRSGRRLDGPPAVDLLPPIDPTVVRAALLDHVRDWPVWVLDMTAPGAQSYSVLTLCRAWQNLRYGRQLSKRQAADRTIAMLPHRAALITWARDWWYAGGLDSDPGHFDDVRSFVTEISTQILAAEPGVRTSDAAT